MKTPMLILLVAAGAVVSVSCGCLAVVVWHAWRRIRDGAPRSWPEWLGDEIDHVEPEPQRDPHVVVLGTPGPRRMVCRDCVQARRDARFDEICTRCEELLISKEARP